MDERDGHRSGYCPKCSYPRPASDERCPECGSTEPIQLRRGGTSVEWILLGAAGFWLLVAVSLPILCRVLSSKDDQFAIAAVGALLFAVVLWLLGRRLRRLRRSESVPWELAFGTIVMVVFLSIVWAVIVFSIVDDIAYMMSRM